MSPPSMWFWIEGDKKFVMLQCFFNKMEFQKPSRKFRPISKSSCRPYVEIQMNGLNLMEELCRDPFEN